MGGLLQRAGNLDHGKLRAANGHPEPYDVRYWEIGNEIWGDWVRGHSDATTYARNFNRYVKAMRAVDPSIRVIAVGDNDMAWNRTVLQLATERADFLAIHHYYGQRDMDGDLGNLTARPLHYETFYGEVAAALKELPADRRPRLAINEWGLDLPEPQQYSILGALYAARLMNVFERRSDVIGMTAVSDLVNGWPGGIIQAGRHALFVTPIYLVNQLYATHLGDRTTEITRGGPDPFHESRRYVSACCGHRRQPIGGWPHRVHQGREHGSGASPHCPGRHHRRQHCSRGERRPCDG